MYLKFYPGEKMPVPAWEGQKLLIAEHECKKESKKLKERKREKKRSNIKKL